MTDADKTIYKICREQAGYTQERAAELLNCSVRQLARYEAGEVQVPDDLAYAMVRLYNSQYLAVEHLRLVSQLAASIIPAVEPVTLQTAAMRLYNTVMDFVEAHPDRDLWLYHGPASASFVLEGDKFVVAFPGDAHAPCIAVDAPEQVHKVVVKVKL